MYDFNYGGVAASSLGVYAVQRPNVPVPERNVELIEVQGMDGSLTVDYGTYKDVTFTVPCNFMSTSPDAFESDARKIRPWLLSTPLLSRLEFTDDAGWCRIVKKVSVGEIARQNKLIGTFDAVFTCDPFLYTEYGLTESALTVGTNTVQNLYLPAKPYFHFSGEGTGRISYGRMACSFILGQDVYIDAARELAYNNNGAAVEVDFTSGSWEDFILPTGETKITTNGTGVTGVTWTPRWRVL